MKRVFPIHPFLFGFFFVAAPLVNNIGDLEPILAVRFFAISLLVNVAGLLLYWYITRNINHSAFLCTLVWISLELTSLPMMLNIPVWIVPVGATGGLLLILWLLLSVFFSRRSFWNHLQNPSLITKYLNLTGITAASYSLFVILSAAVRLEMWKAEQAHWIDEKIPAASSVDGERPDIYYFILDGYGRADILQEFYGLDNSGFLNDLSAMGFYIAEDSHSNYLQTVLSLASSLNLDYLDAQVQQWGEDSTDRKLAAEMIRHSLGRAILERRGYRIVDVSSAFFQTEIMDADKRFIPDSPNYLNAFEQFWILQTPLQNLIPKDEFGFPVWGYAAHRERVIHEFADLVDASREAGPKFVFAHILVPHPPFVIRADGSFIQPDRPYQLVDGSHFPGSQDEYLAGYTEQVRYVNRRLLEIIPKILQNALRPAIIILQADHGPGSKLNWNSAEETSLRERSSILNAFYFPGRNREGVYPSITPVNTFRLICREFFMMGFPPLEDKIFYSTWSAPYRFQDVTSQVAEP
jgi:hypothetical protein